MKRNLYTVLFLLSWLVPGRVAAQADPGEIGNKPAFKLGVYYISHLHYYGRTDSLKSSGFFPLAEYWPAKNFYITAAPVIVMNSAAGTDYAGTVITAGVKFAREKVYSSNIYFVKPFYKDQDQLVQSALKAQVAASYTWLNKLINITAGADIKLSDKLDYGATAGLDHPFRVALPGQSVLVIDPSVYFNAGTRQFTQTSNKNSGFLLFPGAQQEITRQINSFTILSYEFSIPLVFAKGKYQLVWNPAYVLPQNLITVAGRPDLTEKGGNMFYSTMGAKITF